MDGSPFAKAQEHARAAARATQAADTTVAINEHTLAAGEFAIAAATTSSAEALRTLKLLEDHHKRLADLLKIPGPSRTRQTPSQTTNNPDDVDDVKVDGDKLPGDGQGATVVQPMSMGLRIAGQIPSLSQPRFPARNSGSSITNNLNSMRGIRNNTYGGSIATPSVSRDSATGNMESKNRRDTGRSRMQSVLDSEKSMVLDQSMLGSPPTSPPPDEGYSRFYSAFGNIINRISSPLAFAGLPLATDESSTHEEQKSYSSVPTPVVRNRGGPSVAKPNNIPARSSRLSEVTTANQQGSDPDLGKIYCKATVRAMQGLPVNESFYVVPPSGHTMSYASILRHSDKDKSKTVAPGNGTSGTDEDNDDFVDAIEGIRASTIHRPTATEQELRVTVDELRHQNQKLKETVQTLKKRLHVFEASAQSLTESRIMRPKSPSENGNNMSSSMASGPYVEDNLRRTVIDLEQRLSEQQKRAEDAEKHYEEAQKRLKKYKKQWDALREEAKSRRQTQAGGGDSSTVSSRIV